jgi:hypothetical protein
LTMMVVGLGQKVVEVDTVIVVVVVTGVVE